MALRKARRDEINGGLFDRYSLLHAATGAVLARHDVSAPATFLIATAFEFAENPMKKRMPGVFPVGTYDAPANMVGDVISTMVGWGLVTHGRTRIRRRRTGPRRHFTRLRLP